MYWNPRLAVQLALGSIAHHRMVTTATILGVAIGASVVAAILVVDFNTARIEPKPLPAVAGNPRADLLEPGKIDELGGPAPRVTQVRFERRRDPKSLIPTAPFPTQQGALREGLTTEAPPQRRRGEEDYQTMRLAVRLASLLSFFVGAIIVFYTMRFSVVSRAREFCLALCLGEFRRNVSLSLITEALMLGITGALAGLVLALPIAKGLLAAGLSTTGRVPPPGFTVPWGELIALGAIAVGVALLGVLAPVREIYRMEVARVLQPRFLSSTDAASSGQLGGFLWLIPPLLAATWLALRPFLQSWLSVVAFFFAEALIVLALTTATLSWTHPLLRGMMWLTERAARPLLPLESLLAARRIRLSSHRMVFAVVAVTLVFSLLTALHGVTRALQSEVYDWAKEAMHPFSFFERAGGAPAGEDRLRQVLKHKGIVLFRLSAKAPGEFPIRLIRADDVNPWLERQGRSPLRPGRVVFSRTLAARFDVSPGDQVIFSGPGGEDRFEIMDVTDDVGFFAEDGQYVDLKSYAVFSDGNPLFADNLETSLGDYAVARPADTRFSALAPWQSNSLRPWYLHAKSGRSLGRWQVKEIDRDFRIFDFVLLMTILLAAIGVTNTMLIQVRSRQREFSVLRTVGVNRWQTLKMLILEGIIFGIVSALLALVVGNVLGAISVSFLDRFTLFDYRFHFSFMDTLWISGLALVTCTAAAIYPVYSATRISSAESLHYE